MQRDKSIDWLTLKHFWKVASSYRKEFLLSWFTVISALGLTILVPYFIGKILGKLTVPSADVSGYIYALIGVSILSVLANRISYSALFRLQPKVMADLQRETLDALIHRGASFHNNRVSGKLVSDASDYPMSFNQISSVFFIDMMPFALIIVLGITLVSMDSLLIGGILLGMTSLAIYSGIRFRKKMTPWRIKRHAASKAVTAHLADAIVNNQTVKSFGNEAAELALHKTLSDKLRAARIHDWEYVATDGAYRIFGLLAFQIAFIAVVVHQVRANPALLATSIFAFSYTMTLSNRLFQIGMMMRQLEESLLLAMPMTEMLQETAEVLDRPDATQLSVTDGKVDFKKLSFHYADNPRQDSVFQNLDLTIIPGEKVGLVGPSGGGKTTLTKLLLRFEDVQGGSIAIDGQNIAEVTQTSLRRAIAYVPQEPLLFHRSVWENIAYGRAEATTEEVEAAARQAHAHDFIMKLPNAYETIVGERGVKLSGGQRQRIAIARAILKDAPILVLDEATSALDSESEVAIQAALWELMKGRTTIVVAHRLSTIQRLDRIIVLDGGNIVEEGSHKDLLKHKGLYSRLWEHQSGGFLEE